MYITFFAVANFINFSHFSNRNKHNSYKNAKLPFGNISLHLLHNSYQLNKINLKI